MELRMVCAGLFVLGLSSAHGAAQVEPIDLRYDLQAGDEIVYRETFDRDGHRGDLEFSSHSEWDNHVLVLAEDGGGYMAGWQRNRLSVDLLRYREKGKDRIEEGRKRLAEDLKQIPAIVTEANRIDRFGRAALPWSALRETYSELLPSLHEIEALPTTNIRLGESWKGLNPLQITFTAAALESISGDACVRIDGHGIDPAMRLTLWFSRSLGVIRRLDFEGSYPVVEGSLHEKVMMELMERKRAQDLRGWTTRPETRLGALTALLDSKDAPIDTGLLLSLIEPADRAVRRLVLAVFYKRSIFPFSPVQLEPVFSAGDPAVRRLAIRMLEKTAPDEARSLILRALADPSDLVQEAAAAWVRRRWPGGRGPAPLAAAEIDRAWPSLQASAAAPSKTLPPDIPGTTLRPMSTGAERGWPYAIHVPHDYRGDEPFPLLIYLSGGPGWALSGVWGSISTPATDGYLILYPQAVHAWWEVRSGRMLEDLIKETCRNFNVDTNRIYVEGTSNGGTGAFTCATLWPHRLAAAVSLMGAGLFPPGNEPPLGLNSGTVPLLFVHGDRDPVINVGATRDTVDALRAGRRAAPVDMKILSGRQHDLSLDDDAGLSLPFLRGHVRDPFPKSLRFQARTLDFPRHYWVRIDEKADGLAEVSAEIRDGRTIEIKTKNVRVLSLLLRQELLAGSGPLRVVVDGKAAFDGPITYDDALLNRTAQEEADPDLAYAVEVHLLDLGRK